MKKALLLIVIIGLLSACTKEGPLNAGMFGRYELRAAYGGLAGFSNKYAPGNGNIFEFKSDSTYIRFSHDTITDSGNYHIKITGTENGARVGTIAFHSPDYPEAFRIKADTITLGTTITDGIAADYVKIK